MMGRGFARSPGLCLCLAALVCGLDAEPAAAAAGVAGVPTDGAATYRVTGALNLRAGPGMEHPVIVLIPAGSAGINVFSCTSTWPKWCESRWRGYRGWVSACCLVGERNGRPPD